MKQLFIALLWVGIVIPFNVQAQEIVTVTGKITDAETGEIPQALIAINEIGNWEAFGANHHTLMDKKGGFSIKIKKGGDIIVNPGIPYKSFEYKNITTDVFINIKLKIIPGQKRLSTSNPEIEKVETQTYTIKGKITDGQTGKPLQMVTVSERWVYNEEGLNRHTVTDKDGNYTFTIHKGNTINFDGLGYQSQSVNNITSNCTIDIVFNKKIP
ncbi:carboxypeptidase-like regulatory domain-containing protein [Gelidibacter japonicus]|uniref:carboxypeptidase-like regulatory domain-containing protein n=1 Tax=Gelidibacter japonicus TaxID=1962232 RepID=UPI0013CFEAF6|nr:carboxypeptidase regulatory-like domain-containing protein [Gelidibacter japonicus]